jgi:hypothetical protein
VIRILQNRPATISATFEDETGTVVDPGTVTVTVTRADGTILTSGQAAGTGAGSRTFALTAGNTTLLDNLTAAWVSPGAGTVTTEVEIVGGFLFTIAQARAALSDPTYDAQKIRDARTRAEQDIERALNYALVPRYETATLDIRYRPMRLRSDATLVRSVTVAGVTWTSDQLAAVSAFGGFLTFARGLWSTSTTRFDVVVGYERGLTNPPAGASENTLALALGTLVPDTTSGIDPRAESVITVDGTVKLRASDGQFSALGVNEWVRANRRIAIA